jgi:hypothetical protein
VRIVIVLVLVSACGNDDRGALSFEDAFACPIVSACNPLTQGGCHHGLRCAVQIDSSACPSTTACVAPGLLELGASCAFDQPVGLALHDDCGTGAMCSSGRCKTICSPGIFECTSPLSCQQDAQFAVVGVCSTPTVESARAADR